MWHFFEFPWTIKSYVKTLYFCVLQSEVFKLGMKTALSRIIFKHKKTSIVLNMFNREQIKKTVEKAAFV